MLSRDPLGGGLKAPTSQNRYAYALDNPTTYSDPSGLSPVVSGGSGQSVKGPHTLSGYVKQSGDWLLSAFNPLWAVVFAAGPMLTLASLGLIAVLGWIFMLLGGTVTAFGGAGELVNGVAGVISGQPLGQAIAFLVLAMFLALVIGVVPLVAALFVGLLASPLVAAAVVPFLFLLGVLFLSFTFALAIALGECEADPSCINRSTA